MVDLPTIEKQVRMSFKELVDHARLIGGQIVVVGCSTSVIGGHRMGQNSSPEIADAVLNGLLPLAHQHQLYIAIQGCEHINRALVVEQACADAYHLEQVWVVPHQKAGGSLAARAMDRFAHPIVVESIQAHAGIDIGDTFIGMHLKPVVVPIHPPHPFIGQAHLTMARTRPRYIGGPRSWYED